MANINEERLRKFREMGIPQPMTPVDPSMNQGPVKNTEFAKKLAAIKNGAIKEQIETFIEKQGPTAAFVPLEVKKQNKSKEKEVIKELKAPGTTSGPSFDMYEKALFGENTPSSPTYEKASRGYTSDVNSNESTGSEFLADIRSRLAEKFTKSSQGNGQQILKETQQRQETSAGHSLINENELRESITLISTDVCKKLIKQFMSEFLTSEPGLIRESDKIKKAEIVKEDIVKIDGRFFKLTPVTVKKK